MNTVDDHQKDDLNATNKEGTAYLNKPATIQPSSENETNTNTVDDDCHCDDCDDRQEHESTEEVHRDPVENGKFELFVSSRSSRKYILYISN
jgi:hypothetical protein